MRVIAGPLVVRVTASASGDHTEPRRPHHERRAGVTVGRKLRWLTPSLKSLQKLTTSRDSPRRPGCQDDIRGPPARQAPATRSVFEVFASLNAHRRIVLL